VADDRDRRIRRVLRPERAALPTFACIAHRVEVTGVAQGDGAGTDDLDDELDKGTMGGPTAWLFGNEAWGLPDALRDAADRVVSIPIYGRAESLNLSTAAAVCLYASARAQRA